MISGTRCSGLGPRRRRPAAVALLLTLFVYAAPLARQDTAIGGRVTDMSGLGVPGTTIRAVNLQDLAVTTVVADVEGKYVMAPLRPGRYQVEAKMSGFMPRSAELTVVSGATTRWSPALSPVAGRTDDSVEDYLRRLTGPNPNDCSSGIQASTRELMERLLTCAKASSEKKHPFVASRRTAGTDSILFDGWLGTADGAVFLFSYDSAPCGGPACGARFTFQRCEAPSIAIQRSRSQPVFSCALKQ